MTNIAMYALFAALVCAIMAYFAFRRASKMKDRALKAEAKARAYQERLKERAIAEQNLRIKLADSISFRQKLREVKTDEEAVAAVDDFFNHVGRL